jgi:hypothetical protein
MDALPLLVTFTLSNAAFLVLIIKLISFLSSSTFFYNLDNELVKVVEEIDQSGYIT